jgi:hypothetical protein
LALLTTTIGAYPKPAYVKLPDWFKTTPDDPDPTTGWAQALNSRRNKNRQAGRETTDLFQQRASRAMPEK